MACFDISTESSILIKKRISREVVFRKAQCFVEHGCGGKADKQKRQVTQLDVTIGNRLRALRQFMNISQLDFSTKLGITFQQLQKYERAINRISASRLSEIAEISNVPVLYFYEGASIFLKEEQRTSIRRDDKDEDSMEENELAYILGSKETIKLLRAYYAISDATKRKRVMEFISTMKPKSAQSE